MGGVCVEWRKNAPRHRGAPEKWADCGPLPHENVVRALGRSPRASKNLIIRGSLRMFKKVRAAGGFAKTDPADLPGAGRMLPGLVTMEKGNAGRRWTGWPLHRAQRTPAQGSDRAVGRRRERPLGAFVIATSGEGLAARCRSPCLMGSNVLAGLFRASTPFCHLAVQCSAFAAYENIKLV